LNLHRVKKGERLSSIAKRYGQTVRRIMKENGLKSTRLRPGQELIIVREGAR
jgi:LysM repeat protein